MAIDARIAKLTMERDDARAMVDMLGEQLSLQQRLYQENSELAACEHARYRDQWAADLAAAQARIAELEAASKVRYDARPPPGRAPCDAERDGIEPGPPMAMKVT
jgi:hypothetical protein